MVRFQDINDSKLTVNLVRFTSNDVLQLDPILKSHHSLQDSMCFKKAASRVMSFMFEFDMTVTMCGLMLMNMRWFQRVAHVYENLIGIFHLLSSTREGRFLACSWCPVYRLRQGIACPRQQSILAKFVRGNYLSPSHPRSRCSLWEERFDFSQPMYPGS